MTACRGVADLGHVVAADGDTLADLDDFRDHGLDGLNGRRRQHLTRIGPPFAIHEPAWPIGPGLPGGFDDVHGFHMRRHRIAVRQLKRITGGHGEVLHEAVVPGIAPERLRRQREDEAVPSARHAHVGQTLLLGPSLRAAADALGRLLDGGARWHAPPAPAEQVGPVAQFSARQRGRRCRNRRSTRRGHPTYPEVPRTRNRCTPRPAIRVPWRGGRSGRAPRRRTSRRAAGRGRASLDARARTRDPVNVPGS